MNRQAIDAGGWFDRDAATKYTGAEGDYYSDDWHGQDLYRTASGTWIVCHYSCVQGESDRWIVVDSRAATRWLVENKYDGELDSLGPDVAQELATTEL